MNYEVYVQGIDDDDGVRLTNSPGRDQAYGWSPDGAQFVFITDRDGNDEVYIGDTDGGEPRNRGATGAWLPRPENRRREDRSLPMDPPPLDGSLLPGLRLGLLRSGRIVEHSRTSIHRSR